MQMVVATEQDAIADIRASASFPRHDMVRLGPGRGAIAARVTASAVAKREHRALLRGEEPLCSAEVKRSSRLIEERQL